MITLPQTQDPSEEYGGSDDQNSTITIRTAPEGLSLAPDSEDGLHNALCTLCSRADELPGKLVRSLLNCVELFHLGQSGRDLLVNLTNGDDSPHQLRAARFLVFRADASEEQRQRAAEHLVTTILTSESIVDATNAAVSLIQAERGSGEKSKLLFWNPADVQRMVDYLASAEIEKEPIFTVWVPTGGIPRSINGSALVTQTMPKQISRSFFLFNLFVRMPRALLEPLVPQIGELRQAYEERVTGPVATSPAHDQAIVGYKWGQPVDITHVVEDTDQLAPNTIQAWLRLILKLAK